MKKITQTLALKATDSIKRYIKTSDFDKALCTLQDKYKIDFDTKYTKDRYVLYLLIEDCGWYYYDKQNKYAQRTAQFIKLFLESGKININHQDKYGLTMLIRSCDYACTDCVQLFLVYGADPNIQGNRKETPLSRAVHYYRSSSDASDKRRAIECINILLNNGADPDIDNLTGTVRQAITFGQYIDSRDLRTNTRTSIMLHDKTFIDEGLGRSLSTENLYITDEVAIRAITNIRPYIANGNFNLAKKTLHDAYGIDFNSRMERDDSYFLSFLFTEIDVFGNKNTQSRTNLFTIFKLFLDAGIDVNHKNNYGYTLLHLAVLERDPEIIQLLLNYHADVNIENNRGTSPVLLAISCLDYDFKMNKRNIQETFTILARNGAYLSDSTKKYMQNGPGKLGEYRRRLFEQL